MQSLEEQPLISAHQKKFSILRVEVNIPINHFVVPLMKKIRKSWRQLKALSL